jgi:hypothetical protein
VAAIDARQGKLWATLDPEEDGVTFHLTLRAQKG